MLWTQKVDEFTLVRLVQVRENPSESIDPGVVYRRVVEGSRNVRIASYNV